MTHPTSEPEERDYLEEALTALEEIMQIRDTGVIPVSDPIYLRLSEDAREKITPQSFASAKANQLREVLSKGIQQMRDVERQSS